MELLNGKSLLFISAHLDDAEFGCGATINKYCSNSEIYLLGMTRNRRDSNRQIQENRDIEETYNAAATLGLPKERIVFPEVEIDGQLFPECRQKILETLYCFDKKIKPDIIFVPSLNDIHQDHKTVAEAALKAFKRKTVIGYEIVNSSWGFSPNLFITVEAENVAAKCRAVRCYKSQQNPDITTADYFAEEIITGLAKVSGARAGSFFAESFEIYTMLI